jgi:hypothetical protein
MWYFEIKSGILTQPEMKNIIFRLVNVHAHTFIHFTGILLALWPPYIVMHQGFYTLKNRQSLFCDCYVPLALVVIKCNNKANIENCVSC